MNMFSPSADDRAALFQRIREADPRGHNHSGNHILRADSTQLVQRAWVRSMLARVTSDRGDALTAAEQRKLVEHANGLGLVEGSGDSLGWAMHGTRGDAASYWSNTLTTEYGPEVAQPKKPLDFWQAIPVRTVPAGAEVYRVRDYDVKVSGIEDYAPGMTPKGNATVTRGERFGTLHAMVGSYTSADWRQQQHQAFAGLNDDALKAAEVEWAMRVEYNTRLLSGRTGLSFSHFGNLKCKKRTSTVTYGDTSGVTGDNILSDWKLHLNHIQESSRGVYRADTLLIAPRVINRADAYPNYAQGGSSGLRAQMLQAVTDRGMRPVLVWDLQGQGGATNTDACLAFDSGPRGLKQVVGMMPTVVKSWDQGMSMRTAMGMVYGGLELIDGGSTLKLQIPVTA